jgi:acyl phosphate:glycerol-3-phosphate acyltransferase
MLDLPPNGHPVVTVLAALAFGYVLGSIPFGLILTRMAGDVRNIGSGNIGATNVLRTGNKGLAAATLILDMLKGTIAVLVTASFGPTLAILAGFGAFLGHLYPVWLRFKGGKGVATYLGVLIGLSWQLAIIFALVWLVMAFVFRYSSLAALTASGVNLALILYIAPNLLFVVYAIMTAVLFYKHKENIVRLQSGTESKIGAKTSSGPSA